MRRVAVTGGGQRHWHNAKFWRWKRAWGQSPRKAGSQRAFLSLDFVLSVMGNHWEGSRW